MSVDAQTCTRCGHAGYAHAIVSFVEPDRLGACHHHDQAAATACPCEAFTAEAAPQATSAPLTAAQAAADRIARAQTFGASWEHLRSWIATGDPAALAAGVDFLTGAAR